MYETVLHTSFRRQAWSTNTQWFPTEIWGCTGFSLTSAIGGIISIYSYKAFHFQGKNKLFLLRDAKILLCWTISFQETEEFKIIAIYISLERCTFETTVHSNTLFWIVYLNVIVHIVTVNNIIHAITINSGSFMLLTFEIMSQVKGISFCREMQKFEGTPFMHLQVTMADSGEGQAPPYF